MFKQTLLAFLLLGGATAYAQNKPATKPATKPSANVGAKPVTTTAPQFKNFNDSVSYSFGLSVGQYLASQGFTNINYALLNKALEQSLKKQPTYFDVNTANMVMNNMAMRQMAKAAGPEKEKSRKFLDENKKRSGVIVTPTGLQYEILTRGTGAVATQADQVKAHYRGTLIDGKEFDNSYSRGEPLVIGVTSVIKGWTEALLMMPVGSKWRLYIPSELGYGDSGQGSIPPGAALIFDIELLEIVGK